jgi:hypothetical protein
MQRYLAAAFLFATVLSLTACTTGKTTELSSTSTQSTRKEAIGDQQPGSPREKTDVANMTIGDLLHSGMKNWTESSAKIAHSSGASESQQADTFSVINVTSALHTLHSTVQCQLNDLISVEKSESSPFQKGEKIPAIDEMHYEIWTARICNETKRFGVGYTDKEQSVTEM